MAAILTCPDEHELLPVATGEPAGDAVEQHLDACPTCRERVEQLRAELTALRLDLGDGSGPAGDAAPEPSGPAAVAARAGSTEAPRIRCIDPSKH